MNEIKDGGPAFPILHPTAGPHCGLSLRDYFAAAALSAHIEMAWRLAIEGNDAELMQSQTTVAQICYKMADEMLKAREG